MNIIKVTEVLEQLIKKIEKTSLISEKKRKRYLREINSLINEYKNIEIPDNLENVYTSLVRKGKELLKGFRADANSKELNDKLSYYIRYLKAAKADFTGNTNYINKYFRVYLFTSILFLALSPQYFGFVLPAVFFIPIFLGVRGIKNRSLTGFNLSLTVIPVSIMTSFIWIRYGLFVISNYREAINQTLNYTGLSPTLATLLTIIPPILAVILLILIIVQSYRAIKCKDLFV
ncbi:hypothetical protein [Caloranaerobacter azorensis]|uniref:Alpha-glucosidase n=1 Tax=Caloranaerobacter azorensis TaxID=116090 RepID=A0A6P1YAQ3_9FIRM|nr:hypothetical protein [Caloranaerobacter azorensis]QIB25952.1 hypothetical protein G3A45_00640 [Caloranaerobacter azorensis]